MKHILLVLLSLFLFNCNESSIKTELTNNKDIEVELLFEYDGCKVYRFYDSRHHYYTNCSGQTMTTESCGKNCTRTKNITGSGK